MSGKKLSSLFAVLFAATSGLFVHWCLDYTHHVQVPLLILTVAFGLFMAFNIGGNDVANSFGTSVGAGTLSIKQALGVAAIFEVSGAMIAGGAVTDTIRKGIVDLSTLTSRAEFCANDFVHVMMSALLAAGIWLLLATKRGWPVSTTHAIVGGIVGSSITLGAIVGGAGQAFALVRWPEVASIVASWIVSPILGGMVSYALFSQIKTHILEYNDQAKERLLDIESRTAAFREEHKSRLATMTELQQLAYSVSMARDAATLQLLDTDTGELELETDYYQFLVASRKEREVVDADRALVVFVPLLAAFASMVMAAMLLYKGLNNVHLGLSDLQNLLIMSMTAAVVWMALSILARNLRARSLDSSTFLLFSWMQVFTASGFAFSHGSNDIANAVGPFAAVLDVLHSDEINATSPVPPVVMFSFSIALIAGLWFIGKEVIATVGTHLTKMHPASGFAAEISAAAVVLIASAFGIPVSSTHILVGAVLGIGLVNRAANWELMKPIGSAWVVTLPAAAGMSALTFVILRTVF